MEKQTLKQYELVNNSLRDLQRSDLPEKYRWKLEVKLYQLRRLLLLDQVAEMVRDNPDSEQDFLDLYREVKQACESASLHPKLDLLVAVPSEMKKTLYSYCRGENSKESYCRNGGFLLSRH